MGRNERARELHERATRGIPLSVADQAELDAWYHEEDRLEREALDRPGAVERLDALQGQLDAALVELAAAGQRVRELAAQNDALRREIHALKQRLGPLPSRRAG